MNMLTPIAIFSSGVHKIIFTSLLAEDDDEFRADGEHSFRLPCPYTTRSR